MPVTPAHPAVVLALRGSPLPMSALALGSMVPDLPVFFTGMSGYNITHSWWGALTIDLIVTVVCLGVWFSFIRDAIVDLAPRPVRHRLPASGRLSRHQWRLVPVAAAIGSASHITWDAFTHSYGWGTSHLEWLQAEHAGLEGYLWIQYASGVLGLAIVLAVAAFELFRLEQKYDRAWTSSLPSWSLPGSIVAAAAVGGVVAVANAAHGIHAQAFNGVVAAGVAGVVILACLALSWQLDRHRAARRLPL